MNRLGKRKREGADVKKLREKLQNPFALTLQGFLAGGLLFAATRADAASILSALF